MNKLLVHIIFVLFFPCISISQIFSISEIHSEGFPIIKANFSILDESGDYYKDISADDFRISDYFKDVSPSIKVNCIEKEIKPPVSIVLVLDMSQSMLESSNNEIRWDWVINGAKSFISSLEFIDSTKIAIIGFNDNVTLLCDFTNDKEKLIKSVENVSPIGGTLYDPPFLDKNVGAIELLKSQPRNMKRVVVFLTDGNPNVNPNIRHIIFQLQKSNIQVFSITLLVEMNDYLRQIAEESGGKAYAIWDKYKLKTLYELIAFYVQNLQFCELSWLAPYGCSDESKERYTQITFLPSQQTRIAYYQAPDRSVPFLEFSSKQINFGNPKPFDTVNNSFEIRARYKSFVIDSIKIYPNNNFKIQGLNKEFFPIILNRDSVLRINIEFVQDSVRHFQDEKLVIYSQPCDSYVNLYAGIPTIKIINPIGGELFSSCDSVLIAWEGIEKSKSVDLLYSSDGGINWKIIESNIMVSPYLWVLHNNLIVGDSISILIKAQTSGETKNLWFKHISTRNDEYVSSIKLSNDNSGLFLGGNFNASIDFDGFKLKSRSSQDIFLVNLNINGDVKWIKSFGSPLYDSLSSVTIDEEANVYITGFCYNDFDDNIKVNNKLIDNKKYSYIIKLDEQGNTIASAFFGATKTYQNFETIGEQIVFKNQEIIIKGKYKGRININNTLHISDDKFQTFEATFLKNLDFIGFKEIDNNDTKEELSVFDIDNIEYSAINFIDTTIINNQKFISKGLRDFIIYKDIVFTDISDVLDSTVKIIRPYYNKVIDNFNFGDIAVGNKVEKITNPILINNSPFVLEINNIRLENGNKNSFYLDSNYQSRLFPDDSLKLKIYFEPSSFGLFSTELVINFACAEPLSIVLFGKGKCETSAVDTINFNKVELNYEKDSLIQAAFNNYNLYPISINPVVKGKDAVDFRISGFANKIVPANDSVDIQILFTPSMQDERSAIIDWQVQEGCDNRITFLKGSGMKARLSVSSIDWGKRRELSVNDSSTYLINENNYSIKIDSFYFEENDNIFVNSFKTYPLIISGNDSLEIPISFEPNDTLEYKSSLVIVVDSLERELFVPLRGIGILPVIQTEWICGDEVRPNESANGFLKIKNISDNSSLRIYDCQIQDSAEFHWIDEKSKRNIIIPELDSLLLNVLFTPSDIGIRESAIKIFSDAKAGNDINPIDTFLQIIKCESKGINYNNSIEFKDNLLCSSDTFNILIANVAGSEALVINAYKFDESCIECDSTVFHPLLDSSIIINPKKTGIVKIIFQPKEAKNYKSRLELINNQNYNIIIDIKGSGKAIRLFSDIDNYTVPVGIDTSITISMDVPDIGINEMTEINLRIKYNSKNQRFDLNNIYSFLPDIDWYPFQYSGNDIIGINLIGTLPMGYSGKFIRLNYSTYLGDSLQTNDIFGLYNTDCQLSNSLNINFIYEGVCAKNLRLVKFSNDRFKIFEPQPNPSSGELTLLFILPFKSKGRIDLYNEIGKKVLTIAKKYFPSGKNQIKVSLDNLPAGVYTITYFFESEIISKRLMIIK